MTTTAAPQQIPGRVQIPTRVAYALDAILAYLWEEEFDDYVSTKGESHLFPRLVAVDGWLNGHRKSPADFVAEEYLDTST